MALSAVRGEGAVDTEGIIVDGNKSRDSPMGVPPKRRGLESHLTTEFMCSMCSKGGICMGCKNVALEPESSGTQKAEHAPPSSDPGTGIAVSKETEPNSFIGSRPKDPTIPSEKLLFRCRTCKRLAHYAHLPPPDGTIKEMAEEVDVEAIAEHYQRNQDWLCADCISFSYRAEKILAWRPDPPNAQQPEFPHGESISPKIHLPREYLVKWQDRSYRRVQWVPHGWLASIHAGLLRNFLLHGPKVELLEHAVREDQVANPISEGGIGGSSKELDDPQPKAAVRSEGVALLPSPSAERRIPPAWKTVDRVLDVLVWFPREQKSTANRKRNPSKEMITSAEAAATSDAQREWNEAFEIGEVPSTQNTSTVDEWEAQKSDELSVNDIDRVVWAFIKWDDLGYDEGKYLRLQARLGVVVTPEIIATWDSPPRQGEPGYSAFKLAFERFLDSRSVHIKIRGKKQIEAFENRPKNEFRQKHALKHDLQPNLGQQEQLKLMPFQVK
jgi:chromodomain-helicase-DNA-binding protein 4